MYHQPEIHPGVFVTQEGLQVYGTPSGYPQPQLGYTRTMGPTMAPAPSMPAYANYPPGHYPGAVAAPMPYLPITVAPNSNQQFTRNLIGSLTVNAAKLKDPDGNTGYWFVLQDLSVRTEGWFR